MSFVHEDPEFGQLLSIVAKDRGISEALVEKDYWVTHVLWGLHRLGLEIWFKGGTSLSKGFGLIRRFSEDLDLQIDPGTVSGLPKIESWKSESKKQIARRNAYFAELAEELTVPSVTVTRETDPSRIDDRTRTGDYLCLYPGSHLGDLPDAVSPFVRLEVAHARVVPCVERPIGSFIHQHLAVKGMLAAYDDNRPDAVRCLHPLVTLFEKLDAIRRKYAQDPFEPARFVRHYEDAAHIIEAIGRLPPLSETIDGLVGTMLKAKDIRVLPSANDPSLRLEESEKRRRVDTAFVAIAPMFWDKRPSLDEACETICSWLEKQTWKPRA